ncbi:hypothetical protein BKA64DRAFT_675251 [Cadophora sp. MPI-SDFR-AT-0126]|nr:hypothetical protein BKA64DRAFT_675251 [Leotiomycetes sp. MPI-SDFR-AT-0126]
MKSTITAAAIGFAFALPALGEINFPDFTIPSLSSALPIFALGPKQNLPARVVGEIVNGAGNLCEPKCDENGCSYHKDGRLAVFTDKGTGETSIFPHVEALYPSAKDIPLDQMEKYLKDKRIFPLDDTRIQALKGATLAGNKNQSGTVTTPGNYLTDIWINRTIVYKDGEAPICGPGTKAFFSFGADGKVKAVSHRWRPARQHKESSFNPVSLSSVHDSILHQLTAANVTNATVGHVDLCYYDSGNAFIQPALRWTAVVPVQDGATPENIVGYIAAALQPPELVPNITIASDLTLTSSPNNNSIPTGAEPSKRQRSVKVGLYPMKNDGNSQIYEDDVHYFYNALAKSKLAAFSRSQDYWGKTFEYVSNKEQFVNSVNVALTRGHGSEHTFYTDSLDPSSGAVTLDSIPSSGFGPGAGGSLAYWIISTCDTVSTSADYSAANFHLAYDPWWHVFNGLHAVVGFRSEKWTSDGVTLPFAQKLAVGGGFVWSWLNTVNQDSHYNPNSKYGTNSQTGQPIWYGRPSAVVVCGHTDDTVLQMDNLGRPSCLQQWWYY